MIYCTIPVPPGKNFRLALICAVLSYALLEHPVRRSRWLSARPARSMALSSSLTVCGVLLALGAGAVAAKLASKPSQKNIAAQTGRVPTASGSGSGRDCLIGLTESVPVACSFGDPKAAKTLVLFGDSHGDQWSTPLVAWAGQAGWRVVTYLKSSCSVADIPVYNMRLNRFSPECAQWRQSAIAQIQALHPDAIVIAEFSSGYIQGVLTNLGENAVTLTMWTDGLQRSVRALHSSQIPMVVLRDSPTPGRDMKICLARADWHHLAATYCDSDRSVALDGSVTAAEREVASAAAVSFIDLSDNLCESGVCPAVRDGQIVYRDANHLTTGFAGSLVDRLGASLALALARPTR
jgi:hypothetical protein